MPDDQPALTESDQRSSARAQAAARVQGAKYLATALRRVLQQEVRPRDTTIILRLTRFGYELDSDGTPLPTMYGQCPRCSAVVPSSGFRSWGELHELETHFVPAPHDCTALVLNQHSPAEDP